MILFYRQVVFRTESLGLCWTKVMRLHEWPLASELCRRRFMGFIPTLSF
uniref:Uncharacterized protein n=1 Tax=Manihot esculenta TaxID=3983 RepID=A0A2C9VX43_MANES